VNDRYWQKIAFFFLAKCLNMYSFSQLHLKLEAKNHEKNAKNENTQNSLSFDFYLFRGICLS
jgi:hypothetical protein